MIQRTLYEIQYAGYKGQHIRLVKVIEESKHFITATCTDWFGKEYQRKFQRGELYESFADAKHKLVKYWEHGVKGAEEALQRTTAMLANVRELKP